MAEKWTRTEISDNNHTERKARFGRIPVEKKTFMKAVWDANETKTPDAKKV
jgi:hypothetical protein